MISAGGYVVFTILIVAIPSGVSLYKMHKWFRSIRIRIEKKIDDATGLQSGKLQDDINLLKKEVNLLKKDIKILRQLAALINKTPLPEHMTEEDQ